MRQRHGGYNVEITYHPMQRAHTIEQEDEPINPSGMVRFTDRNVDFDSRRGHTCPGGNFDLQNLLVKNGNVKLISPCHASHRPEFANPNFVIKLSARFSVPLHPVRLMTSRNKASRKM